MTYPKLRLSYLKLVCLVIAIHLVCLTTSCSTPPPPDRGRFPEPDATVDGFSPKALPSSEEIKQAVLAEKQQVEFHVGRAKFELVRIPPGEFDMGSPPGEEGQHASETPVRRIRISKAFYLGRYEITRLQYEAVMVSLPLSNFRGDSLPVDSIQQRDALQYCKTLSQLIGLPVTLPTEAQWEYACRAGSSTRFSSGNTKADLDKVAWYRDNAGGTIHPVGQKQPNAWGLYDMHGNAWEPVLDQLGDRDKIQDADPMGIVRDSSGMMRGGGWMHPQDYCRSATSIPSHYMFGGMGIRIAINP